ncbi:MAG: hypothetical protein WKF59_19890 [Chitinophagaceae bacterium]
MYILCEAAANSDGAWSKNIAEIKAKSGYSSAVVENLSGIYHLCTAVFSSFKSDICTYRERSLRSEKEKLGRKSNRTHYRTERIAGKLEGNISRSWFNPEKMASPRRTQPL